jgi:hypothetical protein
MVSVPLVADMVDAADLLAACEDSIALGGGEESAEFSLGSVISPGALVPTPFWHRGEG